MALKRSKRADFHAQKGTSSDNTHYVRRSSFGVDSVNSTYTRLTLCFRRAGLIPSTLQLLCALLWRCFDGAVLPGRSGAAPRCCSWRCSIALPEMQPRPGLGRRGRCLFGSALSLGFWGVSRRVCGPLALLGCSRPNQTPALFCLQRNGAKPPRRSWGCLGLPETGNGP